MIAPDSTPPARLQLCEAVAQTKSLYSAVCSLICQWLSCQDETLKEANQRLSNDVYLG